MTIMKKILSAGTHSKGFVYQVMLLKNLAKSSQIKSRSHRKTLGLYASPSFFLDTDGLPTPSLQSVHGF